MLHQIQHQIQTEAPANRSGYTMPQHTAHSHTPVPARELIAAHGGRVTRTRIAVIEVLQAASHPLSHDEVAAALDAGGIAHDRVTLYRALEWLVEQGIARRIASGERAWHFEIRRGDDHRHAHFHCDRCGQVLCLEDIPATASAALPAGFELDRAELVLHGACADCGRNGVGAP